MAASQGLDRIVMAYVGQYGEELLAELLADAEEDEVYAEVIEEDESRWDNEGGRVDSQVEGEAESLPETAGVEEE